MQLSVFQDHQEIPLKNISRVKKARPGYFGMKLLTNWGRQSQEFRKSVSVEFPSDLWTQRDCSPSIQLTPKH